MLACLASNHGPMQRPHPAFSVSRAAVASLLVAQLLWVLALAAVPRWHERVHPGEAHSEHHEHNGGHHKSGEHECAVTLFLSGACDCTVERAGAVAPIVFVAAESTLREPPWVVFSFRSRGIFEHAPPRRA